MDIDLIQLKQHALFISLQTSKLEIWISKHIPVYTASKAFHVSCICYILLFSELLQKTVPPHRKRYSALDPPATPTSAKRTRVLIDYQLLAAEIIRQQQVMPLCTCMTAQLQKSPATLSPPRSAGLKWSVLPIPKVINPMNLPPQQCPSRERPQQCQT